PLFAQDLPYAFLSTDPKEPTAGAPQRSVPSLLLRANNELPYFIYVRNPGTDERDKLVVLLAADEKGETVLAESSVAKLAGGETVRVKLTAKAPAPAVEKPIGDKPAA